LNNTIQELRRELTVVSAAGTAMVEEFAIVAFIVVDRDLLLMNVVLRGS
jgi:hypothetical protein